jgi:predicted ATPase
MGTRTPLVGREEELARIGEALERARSGNGSLLLVSGEAGVGKSRLAADIVADADLTGRRLDPLLG